MSSSGSFLGRGWHFPPTFGDGGAEVEMVEDADDIAQSLQILFATQLGERVMQEDFGCDLSAFVFEEVDQGLLNRVRTVVENGILYHEPRIRLDRLDVAEDADEPGLLRIRIEYTIRGTNSRFNMVYPFYVREAGGSGA